ncbi:MAG: hypothetical protein V2A67_07485 [Bacteroidota bacterium]
MKLFATILLLGSCVFLPVTTKCSRSTKDGKQAEVSIICPDTAPANVKLAAREVRRYVYLRTGKLLPIKQSAEGNLVSFRIDRALTGQQYRLKSDGRSLIITGGSDVAVLYGAYSFIEKLGIRFYLHGDVIPDQKIPFSIPILDETHEPLFETRGIVPFHDFPEGPDWWTRDEWLSIVSQAAKMRMNFIGLHTYPVWNVDLGPEPTVWIGLPEDVNDDGTVKSANATTWYNTQKYQPYGCYKPGKTSSFSFGGAGIFPTDDYGSEINTADDFPFPKSPEGSAALINRTGKFLRTVFEEARRLGIKTCVGTESPLDIPDNVKAQLKDRGMDPLDTATLKKMYEGMFLRIRRAYPIDYYWIWGHEGEINQNSFINNMLCADAALKSVQAPFGLGICGWGWITGNFPMLDSILPKDIVFSSINMSVGNDPVSPNYGKLDNRRKWAIPWLEDDPALTSIQLHAGRMRRDAMDALKYGCNGLFGLYWRTRILSPNISALAQAGWEQDFGRQPVEDFYEDWALAQFGAEVGQDAAKIFSKLDGNFPRPSTWDRGPGVIVINSQPWDSVKAQYQFADEMEKMSPLVKGSGNRSRFDWWLNTFRYNRGMALLGCTRGYLDAIMARIEKEPDADNRRKMATDEALPVRITMLNQLGNLYQYLLATLNNSTELGTVVNIELQWMLRAGILTGHDRRLEEFLGVPLPPEAQPWKDYKGEPRLVVMNARGSAILGESLNLKIIALDKEPVKSVTVLHRPLGRGRWRIVEATHVTRAVWNAVLPTITEDIEYQVVAKTATGTGLVWPPTAPGLNHTVVVSE